MPAILLSPLAIFAAFVFGIEAVVGYVLGTATGLAELHKTVLVVFLTVFPLLGLLTFLPLAARDQRQAEGGEGLSALLNARFGNDGQDA